ncbi:MAG TPA: tetratricopeptide repeat protein [Anaeromyxobacteraceae bacterium]
MRRWAFRIATAVAAPALLLGAAEGVLRLAGVGHDASFTVPCTAGGRPAFCDNDRFTWQFFPPGAFRLPPPFAIPAQRRPGTFRVVVLGESAAQGDPEPAYSLARYLEVMLRARFPAVELEVVNAAVTAVSSHVLLPMARDLSRREPDLLVVYAGNNEVVGPYGPGTALTARGAALPLVRAGVAVRSTRLGQLLAGALRPRSAGAGEWLGMEMFLGRTVAESSPALARARASFRTNLEDVVRAARRSGARVLLSTVGVSLSDGAPFASLHREGLGAADLARFDALVADGAGLEAAGRSRESLDRYLEAERLDDRHAELQFRIARRLQALGEASAAGERFRRARDLDALRFRADAPLNDVVREVAAGGGPGVELVDGEAALAAASPGGAPGADLFWEHVHLRPRGNYLLARAVFPRVAAALPGASPAGAAEPPTEEEAGRLLALTPFDRRRMARDVLSRLSRAPFTGQLDHAEQVGRLEAEVASLRDDPEESDELYRAAIARSPSDPWLRFGRGALLEGKDPAAAAREFRAALEILPGHYAARDRLAAALVQQEAFAEAAAECRELLRRMPYHAPAWLTLAYALARRGSLDEAVDAYRRAVEVSPRHALDAWNETGRIELHRGRHEAAAEAFRRALELDRDRARASDLLYNLAHALRRSGRAGEAAATLEKAAASYREDLRREPRSAAAHYGLANALAEGRDLAGAAEHFRAAAEIDPADPEAHRGLVEALQALGRPGEAAEAAQRGARALAAAGRAREAALLERQARRLATPR